MRKIIIVLSILLFTFSYSHGQVFSDKVVGKKNKEFADSLKTSEYPYFFPFLGEKAHQAGFDLPYSAGLGINYFFQESDITINNLSVGFNNGKMQDLDEVVRFSNTTSTTDAFNFRPDIWILPFLNVYAIFAKSTTSTNVDFGVWVPKNDVWEEVIAVSTKAEFEAVSTGFGITPTIGVGGGWIALDMNFTWTDIDELDDPAYTFVFGPRFGKSFRLKKPEQNISIWAGGFRVHMNSGTVGSLPLDQFIATDGIDTKIDNGYETIGEAQVSVDDWWADLTNLQQNNPANIAKHEAANRSITAAGNFVSALDGGVNRLNNSSVQYALDKKQTSQWNFIVGAQFQLNKHWMIRAEYGFLGSRTQGIAGLQYRFGL